MRLNTTALRDRARSQTVLVGKDRISIIAMRLEDDVLACCDRIDELERGLRDVLPVAKVGASQTSHPSAAWAAYDAAKSAMEGS